MSNPFINLFKRFKEKRKRKEQEQSDLLDSLVGDKSNQRNKRWK